MEIVGSINGLVCPVPTISSYGTLPLQRSGTYPVPTIKLNNLLDSDHIWFCYKNDYKIVWVLMFKKDCKICRWVQVHSLTTDSWRTIWAKVPFESVYHEPCTFVNEEPHWFVYGTRGRRIFCFDTLNEVFEELPPLDAMLDWAIGWRNVINWNGELGVLATLNGIGRTHYRNHPCLYI